MNTKAIFTTLAALVATSLVAQQVTTDPVGFVSVTIPPASDASLGAPLGRASEFQGVIQAISGNVITVAGTPAWTTNQFVYASGTQSKTYYAKIDSGTKEGLLATVTANGSADVTVTLPAGEDLTGIATNALNTTGDSISIAPYWTPSTLITGVLAGTQILRYPSATAGTNLSATTYVFSGTNWLQGTTPVNDAPFGPFEGFTIRNNSTTVSQVISVTGSVPMTAHRFRLATLAANTSQDIRIFYNSPVPELIGNVFPNTSLAAGDRLLSFDNAAVGKNKSAIATLVWTGSAWLQGTTNVTTTFQLQPGASYLFRKNQTGASASSVVWSDLQSYLQ